MAALEISVILSTYQRPWHLERSLASLACQQEVDGQFEVIVTDDGSQDETPAVVERFKKAASFPVRFLTHRHDGFQLARCRNNGIRAARAPYVLFSDGDCLFPPNHLRRHLAARRPGVVRAGDCVLLDEYASRAIDLSVINSGRFTTAGTPAAQRRILRLHRKALLYQLVGHQAKPKLVGNNIGVWRSQLERINGFDEQFRGWGCEDDDLAQRLRCSGARIRSVLGYTHAYHLWHRPHATTPERWSDGRNVAYLHRPVRLTRCLTGLIERSIGELAVAIAADEAHRRLAKRLRRIFRHPTGRAEIALLLGPGCRATIDAECRIALVNRTDQAAVAGRRGVDAVIDLASAERTPEGVVARLEALLRDGDAAARAAA